MNLLIIWSLRAPTFLRRFHQWLVSAKFKQIIEAILGKTVTERGCLLSTALHAESLGGINRVASIVNDCNQGALELLIIDITAVREKTVCNKVHHLHIEVLRGLHHIFNNSFVMLHNKLGVEKQSFAD
jgi:hypothetical protein